MKNCKTCRWVGCRNYGKDSSSCEKYIMSLEEERQLKKQLKSQNIKNTDED